MVSESICWHPAYPPNNRTEIKCRIGEPEHDQLTRRAVSGAGTAMRDLKWSPAEKAVARKAFDRALGRELEAVILETKSRAAKIQEPSGLWELERYLTQRRQEIEQVRLPLLDPPPRPRKPPQRWPPQRERAARTGRRQTRLHPSRSCAPLNPRPTGGS
jgi:hypothetical protein